jgi:hypothetical protein
MNIPAKIKIGKAKYKTYVVRSLDRKRGEINFLEKQITIATHSLSDDRYSVKERTDTLVHELVHGILKEMGHAQYADEKFVGEFSKQISSVLRQCGAVV